MTSITTSVGLTGAILRADVTVTAALVSGALAARPASIPKVTGFSAPRGLAVASAAPAGPTTRATANTPGRMPTSHCRARASRVQSDGLRGGALSSACCWAGSASSRSSGLPSLPCWSPDIGGTGTNPNTAALVSILMAGLLAWPAAPRRRPPSPGVLTCAGGGGPSSVFSALCLSFPAFPGHARGRSQQTVGSLARQRVCSAPADTMRWVAGDRPRLLF